MAAAPDRDGEVVRAGEAERGDHVRGTRAARDTNGPAPPHMVMAVEELCWGDVGLYLSIPNPGLGGAGREARAGDAVVAGFHPVEHVEDQLALLLRDAGPLIQHLDHRVLVALEGADVDDPAGARIFGGIVQHIDQRLFHQQAIGQHQG